MSAEFGKEKAAVILKLFNTTHPFFGKDWPTPEEAFEWGRKWGAANKAKAEQ